MGDWEEIRRLAADFQRAQSAGAVQKLSERNCVEIVMKLIELKLIDVIYTVDGKEYLTPQQLVREVKDEIYVSGGRCGLVEVASALNVDFSHVENAAQGIAKSDRDMHLILGQLVSHRYLDDLARQVNENLQQKGTISIPSLTKEYDLPADFLMEEVGKRIGSIIEGFKDESDPKVIMTSSHIARNRAKIRGVLSGITVPTSCSSIISRFGFQEKLFFSLADELIRTRRIPGSISGGRSMSKSTYIPHSYARSQNTWIDNFYASNGYLEYDAVSRLGISDPQLYLKKKYKEEKLMYLATCALGPSVVEQIETSVDEALSSGSWIDLLPLLPSILSEEDETELVSGILKGRGGGGNAPLVLGSSILLSWRLVEDVKSSLQSTMETKAKVDVESGAVAQSLVDNRGSNIKDEEDDKSDKKEDRRKKAAGGKAGGGAQGRETKTKSTKKKGGKKRDDDWGDDSDEEKGKGGGKDGKAGRGEGKAGKKKDLEFKSLEELRQDLTGQAGLAECPEEAIAELAAHIQEGLNRTYRELAQSVYHATLAASLQNKRRTHGDLQEKVNLVYTKLRLGEKAVSEFTVEDHKVALSKHLLKTIGSEVLEEILLYVAEDNMIKVDEKAEFTADTRLKIIKELPSQIAEPAMKLHKAAAGGSAQEFITLLEDEVMKVCDVMLKKADKKKDRQILFAHKHELADKISGCQDPALVLHLAVLIIFQHVTGSMLTATGKFVPSILSFLKGSLTEEQYEVLSSHQHMVIKHLKDPQEGDEDLAKSCDAVKEVVAGLKKSNPEK